MVFALVSGRFQPTLNLGAPGSRTNPRREMAPPVTLKKWGGSRTQNLKSNLNSKIHLKITVEIKIFSQLVKFRNSMIFIFETNYGSARCLANE
jgi:hypothetical protein